MWLSIIPDLSGFNVTIVWVLLILGMILSLVTYFTGELTVSMVVVLGFAIWMSFEGYLYGWVFYVIIMVIAFWIGIKLINKILASGGGNGGGTTNIINGGENG